MTTFSILLPTRNRLNLLDRAIQTVLRQDFHDWEIIVSDNCSDENIQPYVANLNDSRIRYQRTSSFVPVTENWNQALQASQGDYVIMLGDDDGLLGGYLSRLNTLIHQHNSPDVIYTCATLYAYPGVMPNEPNGFLRLYTKRPIFDGKREPFLLDHQKAMHFVEASLRFQILFDYNMQFFAVSRQLIQQTRDKGLFYQSPYPDYYAANVVLLIAKRLLVVPEPMIAIGISPKSFGCYYFGGKEQEGSSFLNNLSDDSFDAELRKIILPGTDMNTCWLAAMQTLSENYQLPVKYSRYRELQIRSIFSGLFSGNELAATKLPELRKKLTTFEFIRFYLFFSLLKQLTPRRKWAKKAGKVLKSKLSHPPSEMPNIEGDFETMLDVYDKFNPTKNSTW